MREAITKAKALAERDAVELWSGLRLVCSIKESAGAVTHELHEGRMVPKPAT
jgi:hypothetical protein